MRNRKKFHVTTQNLCYDKKKTVDNCVLPPVGKVVVWVVEVLPSLKTLSMSEARSLLTLRRHGVVKDPDIVVLLSELFSLLAGLLKTEYLLKV